MRKIYSFFLFIFIWYFLHFLNLLPSPHTTAFVFSTLLIKGDPVLGKTLVEHSISSLFRVMAGAGIAFLISVPLGILMWYEKVYSLFHPILEILRPVPPLAWIPLAYILFSSFPSPTFFAQIFIVFVGAFFPSFVSVSDYARNTPAEYIELARVFGAERMEILRYIVVPYSIPGIITGIRVGLGVGWMSIIAAEMIATSGSGVGYFIMVMYEVGGRVSEIISGMAMIGLIGYGMNSLLLRFERRFPWHLKSEK